MRKMYKIASIACLGLMLSSTNIKAQTANFENLILAPESFWDGSDLSGTNNNGVFTSEFTSGAFIFPNVYDTTYGAPYYYWSGGFAYSNQTDSVTSGAGNKYSAKAGSGDGSSNYVVASNNSSFKPAFVLDNLNLKITNSTYAYNSMRDGDAFAKKFGGPTGNDPDWFKVTIKTYFQNTFIDSLDFYLADFRFADNSQDYIIKDWRYIEIAPTNFNVFDSIYFELSSSDVGTWGMNTPAFFCLDNLETMIFDNVEDLSHNNFSFYPNPTSSVLNITSVDVIESVTIIDVTGKAISTNSGNNQNQLKLNVADLKSGIYFVQVVSNGNSQIQKFIKE